MNNLDSRCPNIVNVEIHYNNFIEDIETAYGDRWEGTTEDGDYIQCWEFKHERLKKTFHSLLNDIYAGYINGMLFQNNSRENTINNAMDDMVDLFEDWVNEELIILAITNDDEEETRFRKQTRIGECDGCKMICEECEPLVITDDEEEEEIEGEVILLTAGELK